MSTDQHAAGAVFAREFVTGLDAATCRQRLEAANAAPTSPRQNLTIEADGQFTVERRIAAGRYGSMPLVVMGSLEPVPAGTRVRAAIAPETVRQVRRSQHNTLVFTAAILGLIMVVFLLNGEWLGMLATAVFLGMIVYGSTRYVSATRAQFTAMLTWVQDVLSGDDADKRVTKR